jgi:hypothetical protein
VDVIAELNLVRRAQFGREPRGRRERGRRSHQGSLGRWVHERRRRR